MAFDMIQKAALLSGTPFANGGLGPFGGVPGVPSPTSSATDALAGNLANLGNIYGLTTGLDTAAGAGAIGALNTMLPGASGSLGTALGNINTDLTGQLPTDVIAMLAQSAAETGAGRGLGPMAPVTNADYLRSLGLTSLARKQAGQTNLSSLLGSLPRPVQANPQAMTVSPADEQMWKYLAQVLANAPNPTSKANAEQAALMAGLNRGRGGTAPASSPWTSPEVDNTGVTGYRPPGGGFGYTPPGTGGNLNLPLNYGQPYTDPETLAMLFDPFWGLDESGVPPNTLSNENESWWNPYPAYDDYYE